MGTRAQVFVGNPHDYENRNYLGSIAYDGYRLPPLFAKATTEDEFQSLWKKYVWDKDHYCAPDRPYPFPWAHDIFVSDITVAWFAPEGHPLGAYTDRTVCYGDEAMAKYPQCPAWPDGRKKAVWVLCSEIVKVDRYYKNAVKRIERQIQDRINEIPGYDHFTTSAQYHNCAAFQEEAKHIRESFKPKFDRVNDEVNRRHEEMEQRGAPIPGPAKAHSAYTRQPQADSIMLINVNP